MRLKPHDAKLCVLTLATNRVHTTVSFNQRQWQSKQNRSIDRHRAAVFNGCSWCYETLFLVSATRFSINWAANQNTNQQKNRSQQTGSSLLCLSLLSRPCSIISKWPGCGHCAFELPLPWRRTPFSFKNRYFFLLLSLDAHTHTSFKSRWSWLLPSTSSIWLGTSSFSWLSCSTHSSPGPGVLVLPGSSPVVLPIYLLSRQSNFCFLIKTFVLIRQM